MAGRGGRSPGHLIPIEFSCDGISHSFISEIVPLKHHVPQLSQDVCLELNSDANSIYSKSGRKASNFSELIPETVIQLGKTLQGRHPPLGSAGSEAVRAKS